MEPVMSWALGHVPWTRNPARSQRSEGLGPRARDRLEISVCHTPALSWLSQTHSPGPSKKRSPSVASGGASAWGYCPRGVLMAEEQSWPPGQCSCSELPAKSQELGGEGSGFLLSWDLWLQLGSQGVSRNITAREPTELLWNFHLSFFMEKTGDLPGGPVVKTLRFHCRVPGSISSPGTKIPRALWRDPKKVQNPGLDQMPDSKSASPSLRGCSSRANTGKMLAQLWASTGRWGRGRERESENPFWGLPQGRIFWCADSAGDAPGIHWWE